MSSPRGALAGLSLTMLLSSLGTSIANVALPAFVDAFDTSIQAVQWVVLAYLLAVAAPLVVVGRWGDRWGRGRLLLAGVGVFTVGAVACGLAPTLGALVAARAVQGLGAAAMMGLSMALIGELVPPDRTGRAMGLLGTTSAVGTALGPGLGGLLIEGMGWRAIFLIQAPLGAAALVLALRFLPRPDESGTSRGAGSDAVGALLLTVTLAAYALAMTLGRGRFGSVEFMALAVAAVGGVLFVAVEARTPDPLVQLSLLREAGLRAALTTNALVSTVVMTTLVVGPFYLSRGLGLDPGRVGLVMSVGPLVAALTGAPAGRLVDRAGSGPASLAGLSGVFGGSLLLAVLPASGVPGYLAPLVLLTAGYALFQTANNAGVMRAADPRRRGLVSGLLNLSRHIGLVSGASVMGAIFARASLTADAHTGLRASFAVAALLAASALATGAWGGRPAPLRLGRAPVATISRSPR